MTDFCIAAISRIADLAETVSYEAEAVNEELATGGSRELVAAADLLRRVARDLAMSETK